MKLGPLDQNVPIVDPETGRPTPFFIRQWLESRNVTVKVDGIEVSLTQIQDQLLDLLARQILAGSGLSGGGKLGDGDITLMLNAGLNDLTDVDTVTNTPTDGQVLQYDSTSNIWKPGTVSGGGGAFTLFTPAIVYTNLNMFRDSSSFNVKGCLFSVSVNINALGIQAILNIDKSTSDYRVGLSEIIQSGSDWTITNILIDLDINDIFWNTATRKSGFNVKFMNAISLIPGKTYFCYAYNNNASAGSSALNMPSPALGDNAFVDGRILRPVGRASLAVISPSVNDVILSSDVFFNDAPFACWPFLEI